jgi:hypothetical protein
MFALAHCAGGADTRYYYSYGDEAYGWSAIRSFVSEPTAEQRDRPLTLLAFGDMGKTTQVRVSACETASSSRDAHWLIRVVHGTCICSGRLKGALESGSGFL